jgi:hypothetical protein
MKGGSKRWKMAHKAQVQCHILCLKHCENITQGATSDFCHNLIGIETISTGNMFITLLWHRMVISLPLNEWQQY